eukprot:gene10736-3356_t
MKGVAKLAVQMVSFFSCVCESTNQDLLNERRNTNDRRTSTLEKQPENENDKKDPCTILKSESLDSLVHHLNLEMLEKKQNERTKDENLFSDITLVQTNTERTNENKTDRTSYNRSSSSSKENLTLDFDDHPYILRYFSQSNREITTVN